MVDSRNNTAHTPLGDADVPRRFGAGLSEEAVRRFQRLMDEECGEKVDLPAAWSRAIELLNLMELLLKSDAAPLGASELSPALPLGPS